MVATGDGVWDCAVAMQIESVHGCAVYIAPTSEPTGIPTSSPTNITVAPTYSPSTAKPTRSPQPDMVSLTHEDCMLTSYHTVPCSCGDGCESYYREYTGLVPAKCGGQELVTGTVGFVGCFSWGADESVYPTNLWKNYTCLVTPCEAGMFLIYDRADGVHLGMSVATVVFAAIYNVLF